MKQEIKFGLAGRFKLEAWSETRGRRVLAEFDNLILDQGLEKIGAGGTSFQRVSRCHVGTNSTAPATNQTALLGFAAATGTILTGWAASQTYVPGPPAYTQNSQTWRFPIGSLAGQNLTEVGVGWGDSGGVLFSRALIVNAGGSPTPVTVLADEALDVTYTLRLYIPADVTGSVVIDGTTYNYTLRPAFVTAAYWDPGRAIVGTDAIGGYVGTFTANGYATGGAIGAVTTGPSGSRDQFDDSNSVAAYSAGSLYRDITYRSGINGCVLAGGIKSLELYVYSGGSATAGAGAWQVEFNNPIPKLSTQIFTFTLRVRWARRA